MFKEFIRLSYLYYQIKMTHRHPLTPMWEVMNDVSHIMLC